MPIEFKIGRICEEFGCLPTAAWREMQRVPVGFLETVIDYRNYAVTKAAFDAATSKAELPSTPMMQLVKEIDFELAADDLEDESRG